MNKVLQWAGIIGASILLTACAGKPKQEQVLGCTFPDQPSIAAPGWVCDEPVDGWPVTATGSAAPSKAGYDFMKDHAAAAARVRLAQQMQVQVQNMIKQYAETTGEGDRETVDQVKTSVSKIITNQTLLGTRIIRSITSSPQGYIYVLVGIDDTNTMQNAQSALMTSMRNDEALWQQFRAQQGFEELASEIANQGF